MPSRLERRGATQPWQGSTDQPLRQNGPTIVRPRDAYSDIRGATSVPRQGGRARTAIARDGRADRLGMAAAGKRYLRYVRRGALSAERAAKRRPRNPPQ